jgi:hypothetical protein
MAMRGWFLAVSNHDQIKYVRGLSLLMTMCTHAHRLIDLISIYDLRAEDKHVPVWTLPTPEDQLIEPEVAYVSVHMQVRSLSLRIELLF